MISRSAASTSEPEFAFTESDFRFLAKLTLERTGIVLGETKRNMIYARLVRRLRSLGLKSFRDYRLLIASDHGEVELANMINAITTNLTRFFREEHHFDHLRQQVLEPAQKAAQNGRSRKLRFWSAGSSSGEEAYSIAMTVGATITDLEKWDIRILATDLDTNMLEAGAKAVYSSKQMENVREEYQRRFFTRAEKGSTDCKVHDSIHRLVSFKHLNLLNPWPLKQAYDAVFCRNVVIYFDVETKTSLVNRLIQQVKIDGFLYLGHSESLMQPSNDIRLAGRTTYQRVR